MTLPPSTCRMHQSSFAFHRGQLPHTRPFPTFCLSAMLSVRLRVVLLSVATSWSSSTDNVLTTQSAKMLRRERVMSALIKFLSTDKNFSSGSWKGCQGLAQMALANLRLVGKGVKDQTDFAEHGLGDLTSAQFQEAAKAAESPSAIVVQFLQHAMNW